jgi:hypothetical protein
VSSKTAAVGKGEAPAAQVTEAKRSPASANAGNTPGYPSLDDLVKERSGDHPRPKKVVAKATFANKELSVDDFKRGMSAVAARAQACYHGTQGTAQIKLTVASSGQVSKVSVTGQFAGTPEGQCVVNAVKAATFRPWDGGPQSLGYAYLLAE